MDYHKAKDPKADLTLHNDPGVQSVTKIYNVSTQAIPTTT